MQRIPQGIVHVHFVNERKVKPETIDARTLAAIKEDIAGKKEKYLSFMAFDKKTLVFWLSMFVPNPVPNKLPKGKYVPEHIYHVARDANAEELLGVQDILRFYEKGEYGIKGGMTLEEVHKQVGPELERHELGPLGAFDLVYKDVVVRFIDDQVTALKKR
ncbi:hypothetical protein GF342_03310 [Candidatus Woesearchaeota archaeon]|nr:hypothetical protein [Candidatus Woesearchaeota archaeon]